jgi:predicted site-specific integrase-resolvase
MKLGYARISKADGSQTLDLQIDALAAAGVAPEHLYQDEASGMRTRKPFRYLWPRLQFAPRVKQTPITCNVTPTAGHAPNIAPDRARRRRIGS